MRLKPHGVEKATIVSVQPPETAVPITRAGPPSWRVGRIVDPGSADTSDSSLLQGRLATLGKVMFIVSMSGVCLRALIEGIGLGPGQLTEPNFLWNLAGNLCFGALWFACTGPARPERFILWAENICLFAACVAWGIMGAALHEATVGTGTELSAEALTLSHKSTWMMVLLVLTYAMVIRAAVIPSTARRTRWLTGLLGVPLVFIATEGYQPLAEGASALATAMESTVWWTFTVIICSVISTTIYGLRRKVIQARELGQYTLEEKLGAGGMGMVSRASHAMLGRPTAIKMLLPERIREDDLIRFEREVQMTARLSHPNTVTIFDYGHTQDGIFYYAMELLEGADLWTLVKHCGAQSPSRVVHILERVADALSEAHELGLIHRDIKPSNIVLCARGGKLDVPKVVDFGLVRETHQEETPGSAPLTAVGQVMGTPQYMPPEAILEGQTIDERSDLYALGGVGYFLLTGADVFTRKERMAIYLAHLKEEPVPPSERLGTAIPTELEEIILACLAKKPGDRPNNAAELRDRLRNCSEIPRWGDEQAREWWATHGDELPGNRSEDKTFPEVPASEAHTIVEGGLPKEQ